VCACKGREEVIKRNLVGYINCGKLQAPLVPFTVEEIVISYGKIEKVARRNTGRIVIIVLGARRGNGDQRGPKLSRQTRRW
jgi:hypothetical protein